METSQTTRSLAAATALIAFLTLGATRPTAPANASLRAPGPATWAAPIAAPRVLPAGYESVRPPRHDRLLVRIERPVPLRARPGAGRVVGTMPSRSLAYRQPIVVPVLRVGPDGRFALVSIPYAGGDQTGWLPLRGSARSTTSISVVADLSEHRISVLRGERVLFTAPVATGRPTSPTPPGRYFVTDRVPFEPGGPYGTFAFGLSGIQTRLPPGWRGGNQLAIHGTNDPGSVGSSASAGCLRVTERTLDRLRPLLRPGTPVLIVP